MCRRIRHRVKYWLLVDTIRVYNSGIEFSSDLTDKHEISDKIQIKSDFSKKILGMILLETIYLKSIINHNFVYKNKEITKYITRYSTFQTNPLHRASQGYPKCIVLIITSPYSPKYYTKFKMVLNITSPWDSNMNIDALKNPTNVHAPYCHSTSFPWGLASLLAKHAHMLEDHNLTCQVIMLFG